MLDNVEVIAEGEAPLLCWMDPDDAREWFRENKSREMRDKLMEPSEAVNRFIRNGSYIAFGGFGHVRVPMVLIYEMIRQGVRDLTIGAKTAVHDIDILIAAGSVSRVEVAYAFGHELRGLSPAGRRAVESGKVKIVSEWSNAAFQWRFKAAAMGLPFIPTRIMMGTDTFRKSSAKVIRDPYSGKPVLLIPACYPDVAVIHVHRADRYGNAQILGHVIEDFELARAAKRLIITAEEIVSTEKIREEPHRTTIPYFLVDAVIEQPFGSHPCNMPYLYASDEEHMAEYLNLTRTEEGVREYLNKYVYGVRDFWEYLERVGGLKKLKYLMDLERGRAKPVYPWVS
ncbi:MAG: CoA-transferase [Sulfolobales archaeon]